MKHNNVTIVVAALILIGLLLYTVAFQVRFDQMAIVTTFGKAEEGSVYNADPEKDESGIRFKWPFPVNGVKVFDKRVQLLQDRPEELQTKDRHALVVQAYLSWRIVNPLDFYKTMPSMDYAQKQLTDILREASRTIGKNYNFDDLTNTDPQKLRLEQLEADILGQMNEKLAQADQAYGVELLSVGIKRILLAPKTTEAVFESMKADRQSLARETLSQGDATADEIKSKANDLSLTILDFAEARAEAIRAEGKAAAARYMDTFKQDQEFAIFLRKMDALEKMLSDTSKGKTTFYINAKDDWLFKEFVNPPGEAARPAPLK